MYVCACKYTCMCVHTCTKDQQIAMGVTDIYLCLCEYVTDIYLRLCEYVCMYTHT